MYLNIINNSSYKTLNIICNGNSFLLKKDDIISNLNTDDNCHIEIQISENNKVLLNLLFALIDGFVDGESVINSLVCNVSFDINTIEDSQTIVIKDIEHRDDKNGYIYESVYPENSSLKNITYSLTNTDKARKKALFYYIFVVSWLPVLIALSGYYFLVKGNVLAILAALLILLVFTIPSWKKANKMKKYYSSEYANKMLNKEYEIITSDIKTTNEPTYIIGKATYKVLDFLFKNKKH